MQPNGILRLNDWLPYQCSVITNHGEDMSRMKSLGMLIDGAAMGENPDARARFLLQIFTRKMVGPIFFEAIQRKGDTSFGEGNAKALFEAIKREQDQAKTSGAPISVQD